MSFLMRNPLQERPVPWCRGCRGWELAPLNTVSSPPGWLQREVRGGRKAPWWRPRKYWFVLTQESLDCYSGCEVGAQRLGSLVLTSLCSVLWPDKHTYKETGKGAAHREGCWEAPLVTFVVGQS